MRKVWIDIVNEAHARFWRRFLSKYGAPVLLTTRRKGSLVGLLKAMLPDREVMEVGEWGASDYEKLLRFAERVKEFASILEGEEVSSAISKGSVEQARVAFGLGIPYIAMNDNDLPPHVITKLTFPLASVSIVPSCFSGPTYGETVRFRGVFEVSHVLDYLERGEFKSSDLGLEEGNYLILRDPPVASHYLKDSEPFGRIIRKLSELEIPVVRIRREGFVELPSGERVEARLDGISLISRSAGVISGGGTMLREAALLGLPSISLFPREEPCVTRVLMEAKLILKAELESLVETYRKVRREWESGSLRERAFEFLKACEDPVDVAIDTLRRFSES
ncbi:MAG: DUF354 domain-containing protein [Candidatus Korarchaeum sp.]|nr:DUF354 domain-containing protein [Candidatus Korarchaeum sp.]MDW8034972.1 DUF354 domain-containing protein [Candidatus Korarchaeum sp.]